MALQTMRSEAVGQSLPLRSANTEKEEIMSDHAINQSTGIRPHTRSCRSLLMKGVTWPRSRRCTVCSGEYLNNWRHRLRFSVVRRRVGTIEVARGSRDCTDSKLWMLCDIYLCPNGGIGAVLAYVLLSIPDGRLVQSQDCRVFRCTEEECHLHVCIADLVTEACTSVNR